MNNLPKRLLSHETSRDNGTRPGVETHPLGSKAKVLLTSVFGPYAQDDEYGSRANKLMELFHNQVTRGQGIASFRFHHRSFGLYFIASNIDADVTVLDFPSKKRFEKELRKGYDIVGISFIPGGCDSSHRAYCLGCADVVSLSRSPL